MSEMESIITWRPVSGEDDRREEACLNDRIGYVAPFEISAGYNWQAYLNSNPDCRLSGSATSLEDAKAEAERHMRMPDEELQAAAVRLLLEDIRNIEARIERIRPNMIATGYRFGFKDGLAEAMRLIGQKINGEPA